MRVPISSINNDQNIGRVVPKMNEDFQYDDGNSNLIDSSPRYPNHQNNSNFYFTNSGAHNFSDITPQEVDSSSDANDDNNCQQQVAESEVKSLKEWLILHNDLIQQQNDEILEKERQIYLLKKENDMLKERLFCLEKGVPYLPAEQQLNNSLPEEDMTQDSCQDEEEDIKENIEFLTDPQKDNIVSCSLEVSQFEVTTSHIQNSDAESQVDTTIDVEEDTDFKSEQDDIVTNDLSDSFKTESDTVECGSEYNFTVNSFSEEFDPMKNIKMSIRRKRVSSSSVLSNNEPLVITGEKKTTRRLRKKRRRLGKDTQILTTKDPYCVCHPSDLLPVEPELTDTGSSSLEVPRWRVKHYTSCYTMEGTENLDDEVYNKRHMRLEIDERRRKRWDVQRIREQRVIEKLKQRQERIAAGARGDATDQDSLTSLWPKADDVRYLEVVEELPVAAFGHPIPKFTPSYFSLPWLNNLQVPTRRASGAKRVLARERKRSRNRR